MLISSFLSQRKFRVSVEGEMSASREMQAGVPQGSVLSPAMYNIYINDTPKHLVFIQPSLLMTPVTECKKGYVLRKLQRGLDAIETWCERWNIKINEDSGNLLFS
jgi:hypothetical protein